MKIFALSDLHLPGKMDKTMDMFGERWQGHFEKIQNNWKNLVSQDDVVLICGDISWAMHLEDAIEDLESIAALPGRKIIIRGNHDYWWQSITKVREALPESITALQNDAVRIENFVFAGTRGWMEGEGEQDKKIFDRELIRLDLTLSAAARLEDENSTLITLMHYPPQTGGKHFSAFCNTLEAYGAKYCVYGHLHSLAQSEAEPAERNGINYILSSCDMIGFSPRRII